ncbi:hypothetical protein GCM10010174_77470 [Kutzneria viridogrisea]
MLAVLALGGCGTAAAPPPDPDAPAVAWVDQICQSAKSESPKLAQAPTVDPANPQQARASLVGYLDTVSGAVQSLAEGIKKAGPAPVEGGQEAVDKALGALTSAQQSLAKAKTTLSGASITDTASYEKAVAAMRDSMAQLGDAGDPTAQLRKNKALDSAFAKAQHCS